jgi:hypothetical protein
MGPQETIGQGFIFTQESEKQVLSLYIRRPELAGFVACEKDDAPGFLRVAFKHNAPSPDLPGRELLLADLQKLDPWTCPPYSMLIDPYIMQSKGPKTQALKRFCKPLITLPKERLSSVINSSSPMSSSCTFSA